MRSNRIEFKPTGDVRPGDDPLSAWVYLLAVDRGILGLFSLLVFGLGFACAYQLYHAEVWEQKPVQAQQELAAYREFVQWLVTQKNYKNALKQHNQQVNEGAKKR